MATLRVFTDANVLYASVVRDLVMELAKAGAVTLLWSEAVHDEWTTALLRNRPDLDKSRISRTRTLLTRAIPDAMVANYEHRCAGIALPDSNDIHVLEGKRRPFSHSTRHIFQRRALPATSWAFFTRTHSC